MSRRIVTYQLQSSGAEIDGYSDRLLKYIPAEIVASWIMVTSLIAGSSDASQAGLLWVSFGAWLLLTAGWTFYLTKTPGKPIAVLQILVSVGAFVVWVFALGGPFATLDFFRPIYGSVVLIFYTLLVPLIPIKQS